DIRASGVDHESVCARDQHTGKTGDPIDGDRLGDRDGTIAAWIERVDLPCRSGLRNRSRECLAWRGAAARIGIVANAGHPGACGSAGKKHTAVIIEATATMRALLITHSLFVVVQARRYTTCFERPRTDS